MTSSGQHHPLHAKFRWTENLTCRFIQLRKENGNLFTGRKYSAQSGWEYILRQMREEFPTIMTGIHYRVLKKKWSNLLQQYKELKNPVHGDKNKADDISWPFYTAIDEVLSSSAVRPRRYRTDSTNEEEENDEDDVNPQEFLYVSVTQDNDDEEDASFNQMGIDGNGNEGEEHAHPTRSMREEQDRGRIFDSEQAPKTMRRSTTSSRRRRNPIVDSSGLLSRLPSATELTIRSVPWSASSELPQLQTIASVNGSGSSRDYEAAGRAKTNEDQWEEEEEEERPRKHRRNSEDRESRLERRIAEFMDYTKRRDEENRNILMRMLEVMEDIKSTVGSM